MEALDRYLAQTKERFGSAADAWIAGAPTLLGRLQERWELELDEPVDDVAGGLRIPATRADTQPALLKLAFPDGWFLEGSAALAHWDGRGVTTLIDHDPQGAQLLERPEPGTPLRQIEDEDEALGHAAAVAERLWIADPGGITTVKSEVLEWARTMAGRHHLVGRPFERASVHEAVTSMRELVPTQEEAVLLHGDLRRDTIVAARSGSWLATDPMPLIGERCFDAASLVRDVGTQEVAAITKEQLVHRIEVLSARLELDADRLRRWTVACAVDQALWSFEAGDQGGGERQAQVARLLRD